MTTIKSDPVAVTVRHEIKAERIEDLLCTALEGGSNYWAEIKSTRVGSASGVRYAHELPMRGGVITLADSSGEEWPADAQPVITRRACVIGLQVMADKFPQHFVNFVQGHEDAVTGDVFLQCCVFGDIVFG